MQTRGLQLDDAPPLWIPLSFFVTALAAVAAAGVVLLSQGASALTTRWSPTTIALTHVVTLGFVTMVMLGAIHQMVAVVLGSPAPRARLAHGVLALFGVGVALLVVGLASLDGLLLRLSIPTLGVALLSFAVPVLVAVSRAESRSPTSFAIGAAVVCLLLTGAVGLTMAAGLAGAGPTGSREIWTRIHVGVALLGWVGSLVTGVSWRVVPMFYLSREVVPSGVEWLVQIVTAVGAGSPAVLLLAAATVGSADAVEAMGPISALLLAPAMLAVWLLHPAVTWWSLGTRSRRRVDGSLLFWRSGLVAAPLAAFSGIAAFLLPWPSLALLFGWLAIWGWAAMIVHGMLTRIVPFLVWLHRFAPLVGEMPVPSVKKLLPDRWTRIGFALHLSSLACGAAAILTGADALARLTGLGVLATAASLSHSVIRVVARRSTDASAGGRSGSAAADDRPSTR